MIMKKIIKNQLDFNLEENNNNIDYLINLVIYCIKNGKKEDKLFFDVNYIKCIKHKEYDKSMNSINSGSKSQKKVKIKHHLNLIQNIQN